MPRQIDEYRLIRPLGEGGMGRVYLAHDIQLRRDVAIKLTLRSSVLGRERFAIEARAAARLQHPNIVSIYRVGVFDGVPYIASEYVPGQSLADLARPVPGERVLEIAIGIARGLAAAHRQNVMHRDIKPDNIILDDNGEPKITDFGLAKLLKGKGTARAGSDADVEPEPEPEPEPGAEPATEPDSGPDSEPDTDADSDVWFDIPEARTLGPEDDLEADDPDASRSNREDDLWNTLRRRQHLTREGARLGTPYYMAPEIWLGESANLRSDIYSFGALLYELCTGRVPHQSVSPDDLALTVIVEDPPPLCDQVPDLDPNLIAVIERCLQRDPDRRFPSGDAVLDALTALRSTSRVVEIPPGGPFRGLLPFESEHRGLFFGRDGDIREVIDRLRTQPVVVVTGESGVGKSSLVRAGVGPRVVDSGLSDGRTWRSVVMLPGSRPLSTLANELARHVGLDETELTDELSQDVAAASQRVREAQGPDAGLLLMVDQLEELVTLSEPEQAAGASRALVGLVQRTPGLRMITTVRADKLAGIAELPGLGRELERALYILRPLDEERIRETIVGPAAAAGFEFESDRTVTTLARSATEARSGLPVLQFALTELWQARDREREIIPDRALDDLGGVEGALSRHADSVLDEQLPEIRDAVREVMIQLVTLHGTRARHDERGLTAGDPGRAAALRALVAGRLVVAREADGRSTYEVAHEALITHWKTLRDWIDNEGSTRAIRQQLALAAQTWERMERTRGALWRDRSLRQTEVLDLGRLSPLEADFVIASRRDETRGRRIRAILAAAAFLILAVVLLVVLQLNRQSGEQRERAETLSEQSASNASRARVAEAEATRRMLDMYIEQGRLKLLDGAPLQAFTYLLEAHRNGADDPATRFMLARATDALDDQLLVLPAHRGVVTAARFTPDGAHIVTTGEDGMIKLWDAGDGALRRSRRGHEKIIWALEISPDGDRFITAGRDGKARMWDTTTGEPLWTATHEDVVQVAMFSPDGGAVITASWDGAARIWDAKSGDLLRTLAHPEAIKRARLAPDGKTLITGSRDHIARIWDLETGRQRWSSRPMGHEVSDIAISRDGARAVMVSWSGVGQVVALDGRPGSDALRLEGHRDKLTSVAFSPDGARVITASLDNTARIWDARSGAMLLTLRGHESGLSRVMFDRDGARALTLGYDGTIRAWDATSGELGWIFVGHRDGVWSGAFDHSGDRLVTGGLDGTARVWRARKRLHTLDQPGHDSDVRHVAVSPDGQWIATAENSGRVTLWTGDGERTTTIDIPHEPHVVAPLRVTWSPDSRRLLAPLDDRAAEWDARSGALLRSLEPHGARVHHAIYTPDGAAILTAGDDGTIKRWDGASLALVATLRGHDQAVAFIDHAASGTRVLSAGMDGTIRLWDGSSGIEERLIADLGKRPHTARFSRDGRRVIVAQEDKTATIWPVRGERLVNLEGHAAGIQDAAFSPDDYLVATACDDHTIKVWDASNGVELWSIDLDRGGASAIAFSADGETILAGDGAHLRMWPSSYEERHRAELDTFAACRVGYAMNHGRLERIKIDNMTCNRRRSR